MDAIARSSAWITTLFDALQQHEHICPVLHDQTASYDRDRLRPPPPRLDLDWYRFCRDTSKPRMIQHKNEAKTFYRFLSIVYDHIVNPGHWTVDMRTDALEPAKLDDPTLKVRPRLHMCACWTTNEVLRRLSTCAHTQLQHLPRCATMFRLGKMLQTIMTHASLRAQVVDVGGGTGFCTQGIVQNIPPQNVTLIDQSPHQLAKARGKPDLQGVTIMEVRHWRLDRFMAVSESLDALDQISASKGRAPSGRCERKQNELQTCVCRAMRRTFRSPPTALIAMCRQEVLVRRLQSDPCCNCSLFGCLVLSSSGGCEHECCACCAEYWPEPQRGIKCVL